MTKINYALVIFFACGLASCVEDVPVNNDTFVKVYGKESGSFGNTLYEYPNGDILIGSKVDVPALDFTNSGGVFEIGKVIEGSPALIKVDANGNQLEMNLFPIGAHDFSPVIQISDISNLSRFKQVLPLDDGGFMIIGEWRGFDVDLFLTNDTISIVDNPNSAAPFLMRINNNFTIDFIRSFNAEEGWDQVYRVNARMKMLPDGNIGILHGFNIYDFDKPFQGYSFEIIDQAGNNIYYKDYYEPIWNIKMAHDLVMTNDGTLCLIGQANDNIYFIYTDPVNPNIEWGEYLDNAGNSGQPNTNPMYIEQFDDGTFITVFTDPPQNTKVCFVSADYKRSSEPIVITDLPDEYPRAFYVTQNEDVLIYTEYLAKTTVPAGYLYRINRQGERVFRIQIEGTPGDVIESADGSILVLSNPLFNGLIPKTRLTKLTADGRLY